MKLKTIQIRVVDERQLQHQIAGKCTNDSAASIRPFLGAESSKVFVKEVGHGVQRCSKSTESS